MRGRVVDRRGFGIKEKEIIYIKGRGIESENNLAIPWYTSSRIWRKMKDNGAGNKELLVARSNERCGIVCRRL